MKRKTIQSCTGRTMDIAPHKVGLVFSIRENDELIAVTFFDVKGAHEIRDTLGVWLREQGELS